MAEKEIRLSVEASNKLRDSLGLKKLNEEKPDRLVHVLNEPEAKKADPHEEMRKERSARGKRARDAVTAGRGIADEDGDEDADAWVKKMRSGGGGALPRTKKLKPERDDAGAQDRALSKMHVRHSAEDFVEGETELTLADEQILNKDGTLRDEDASLENPQMRSKFSGSRNQQIRMESLQGSVHEQRSGKDTALGGKYDELPEEPEGFTLGAVKDGKDVAEKLEVLTRQAESLQKDLKFQSDFLTSAEIRQRKPKKARKRKQLEETKEVKVVKLPPTELVDSEDEDAWLYEQLSRQRRILRQEKAVTEEKRGTVGANVAAEQIVKEEHLKEEAQPAVLASDSLQTVTGTTEFCKNVQTAQEKLESRRYEAYTGAIQFKQQQLARQRRGVRFNATKKRLNEEGMLESEDEEEKERDKEDTRKVLSEEVLDGTTASAIAYLRSRNDILKDQDNHRSAKGDNKPLEMAGEIRTERRDEFGRIMTPKEAFQQMSWIFHGKRPANKNATKRLVRLEQEIKNRAMEQERSLPTLRALRHVQKDGKAHVQLTSGVN